MAWTDVVKKFVTDGIDKAFLDAIIDNMAHLKALFSQLPAGLLNGDLDNDTDGDGVPDAWARTLYTNGAGAIDASAAVHGAKAYKFTRSSGAGNGGGYLETDSFIPVGPGTFTLDFWFRASAALGAQVDVRLYDKDFSYVTSITVLNSSTATAWRGVKTSGEITGRARWAKIRLTGGKTSPDVAGAVYFDHIVFNTTIDNPFLSGAERHTNSQSYTTAESFRVYIPKDATTITGKADLKMSGAQTGSYAFRVAIGTDYGAEATGSNYASYSQKSSSLTIPEAVKDSFVNLLFQYHTTLSDDEAYIKTVSDNTNGFENNVVIV